MEFATTVIEISIVSLIALSIVFYMLAYHYKQLAPVFTMLAVMVMYLVNLTSNIWLLTYMFIFYMFVSGCTGVWYAYLWLKEKQEKAQLAHADDLINESEHY